MSFISVVIITYNRSRLLKEALASVKAQTFHDYEVIVVDDGSTDRTKEAVRRSQIPCLKYHRLPQNLGVAKARNEALKLVKSPWVAFLDSDDLWYPHKLKTQVEMISKHRLLFVYSDLDCLDRSGKLQRHWGGKLYSDRKSTYSRFRYPPVTSSVMVRADWLARAGPFDTHFKFMWEDVDLWERVGKILPRKSCRFIREPLIVRRLHSDQNSHPSHDMSSKTLCTLFETKRLTQRAIETVFDTAYYILKKKLANNQ